MSLALYEIRSIYDDVLARVENAAEIDEGVIPDELAEQLEKIEDDLQEKVIACGIFFKNKTAEAEAIDNEIKVLQSRKKALENQAHWIKRYLQNFVPVGMKVSTPKVAIGWRKSIETVIIDEAEIPEELCKIKIEPSKSAIKAAIESGQKVPGAYLQSKNNIQIR